MPSCVRMVWKASFCTQQQPGAGRGQRPGCTCAGGRRGRWQRWTRQPSAARGPTSTHRGGEDSPVEVGAKVNRQAAGGEQGAQRAEVRVVLQERGTRKGGGFRRRALQDLVGSKPRRLRRAACRCAPLSQTPQRCQMRLWWAQLWWGCSATPGQEMIGMSGLVRRARKPGVWPFTPCDLTCWTATVGGVLVAGLGAAPVSPKVAVTSGVGLELACGRQSAGRARS